MVEVTQDDREAAADLASMSENICFGGNDAAAIRNGISIDRKIDEFVERVARHRIAAFNAGLEAAAKVAGEAGINREEVASNHHDFTARYHNECRAMEAREIATAIRNLKIGEE